MGIFFKKKSEVKQGLPELPPLKPETTLKAGLTPSPLKSEIEHIRPMSEIPPVGRPLPAFPRPREELREMPEAPIQPKELPEFPEFKEVPAESRLFEEESVYEVGKEVEELKVHTPVRPVFVEVDKFKDVLDDLNSTKISLKDGEEIMAKLEEIRLEKDKNFDKWKTQMEDIQRKLIFIDRTLFEIKYV